MNSLKRLHKQISAFYDAEFEARDVEFAIAKLCISEERAVWSVYQKIGDVLRADLAGSHLSKGFDGKGSINPNLSISPDFAMLVPLIFRWGEHENWNGLLDGTCGRRQA